MKEREQQPFAEPETKLQTMPAISPGEIIIGILSELNDNGEPMVRFTGVSKSIKAMTTTSITAKHIGEQVALLFSNGDIQSPVIMGIIHNPLTSLLESFEQQPPDSVDFQEQADIALNNKLKVEDVLVDGKKIIFNAKEQIVLKCGESSITLTKAGKILIRGKYLLNRSTGVNRIMGGSVQVN